MVSGGEESSLTAYIKEASDPESGPLRSLGGMWGRVVSVTAILFAAFVLYTSEWGPWPTLINRAIFLAFALVLVFSLYPRRKKQDARVGLLDVACMTAGVAACVYIVIQYEWIVENPAETTTASFWLGLLLVGLLLEGMRRTLGWPFVLVAVALLLYAYFGNWVPGQWGTGGFDVHVIVETLYLTDRGIWGVVTGIVATVVAMYVVFGAVIFASGGGETFIGLSLWLAGHSVGGAAKMATVASGFFGMISGSSAANAATVGSFTIPTMRRLGYPREYAAGVEAAASTGGQIMPPVMGAGAFVMAELLQVPYLSIALAAAIPAVIYYLCVLSTIHFEAKRKGFKPVPQELIPPLRQTLMWRKAAPLFIPVAVMIWNLLAGGTPVIAGVRATVVGLVLYIVLGDWKPASIRNRMLAALKAIEAGGKGLVMLAFLGAGAQVIIAMVNLTGVGVKLSDLVISASGGSLATALVLTAFVCTVLGMGVTTTGDYIIAAAVIGPALVRLGVTPFIANLFIFYWACSSALTPPVAAAVFVTAGIAGSQIMQTAVVACRLAIAAFIVPFIFVYVPALLLQGSATEIIVASVVSTIGLVAFTAGLAGFLVARASVLERATLLIAGLLLLIPVIAIRLAGLTLLSLVLVKQGAMQVGRRTPDLAAK